jgi:hypothetical protein
MNVEEIEVAELRDLSHPRGQCEIIRGELEQRVARDRNLVIEDAVIASAEPEGLRVGDEVNLVTGCCEFDPKFSRNYSRPAIRGITRDPDAHHAFQLRSPTKSARCLSY